MAEFQGYCILFLIGVISTILIRALQSKPRLPPTPFPLPIIGHLHLFSPSLHQTFHRLSIRYGPVFRIFMGSTSCVVFRSPDIAKELFKTCDGNFLDRPRNSFFNYITYEGRGFIFAPYGSYWKFMKKIVMSELLNGKVVNSFLPVRHDEINRFLRYLSEKANVGKSVQLDVEVIKMTNNIISRMLMSKRCSDEDDEAADIRKIVTEIPELTFTFNLSDHIWLFKNLDFQGIGKRSKDIRARFDAMMEKIMRTHEEERKQKESGEVKDFLHILLGISEDETMEIKLTREHIKAFVLEIFGASTGTSAITIEWALAELINHPTVMKKAVEEIDQVVGKNRLIQESDIPNLPYLQAIIKESLRLHPSTPLIQRLSKQDCTVAGYHIPAKTTIFYNIWGAGRDPTHWENPLEFRPERFIEKMYELRGQHFELLPFGSGRRMCPGTSLALTVVHVTLGCMIQCFEWKAGKDGNLTCVDMEEGTGVSLPRVNPLVCVPVARLHPLPLSI